MFGIDDAIMGGLISGGLSLIGGERRNSAQADQAEQANAFSAQQFATRYQTTVKDMEAAGLNPMLAYSQGGGTPPSGQQAQMQDTMTPAVQSFNNARQVGVQSKIANAQVANVEADTANKQAQADLIQAQIAQTYASAGQSNAQVGLINATVDKTIQETENLKTDKQRVTQLIDNLRVQYDNLIKEGYNLTESGNVMRATISKMNAEVPWLRSQTSRNELLQQLDQLDLDAANFSENFGRNFKEFGPVIRTLRSIFRK